MSAQSEILENKHDILKQKDILGAEKVLDMLFENFLAYASANWNYSAQSGKQTAMDLLSGSGAKNVACGTLREAFKLLVREQLKLEAANEDINGYFITKPTLKCFDTKVTGNMANPGSHVFNLGCHFSAHYFVKCGGKYYDPCLNTTYARADEPILMRSSPVPNAMTLRYAGSGRAVVLLRQLLGQSVTGFGTTWEVYSVTKDDLGRHLTPKEYAAAKAAPVLKGAGLR